MTNAILHRRHDTITNENEPSQVVINEETLTDYAINEINEARKEIKRGEFYTEKDIFERQSELQTINRILDRRYKVLIELS